MRSNTITSYKQWYTQARIPFWLLLQKVPVCYVRCSAAYALQTGNVKYTTSLWAKSYLSIAAVSLLVLFAEELQSQLLCYFCHHVYTGAHMHSKIQPLLIDSLEPCPAAKVEY